MPPEAAPEVETPWSGGGAQNPKTNVTFLMSRKYVSKQETALRGQASLVRRRGWNPKPNVTFLMSRKYVSKQETGAKSETARHSRKLFVAVSRSVTPLETPGR